MCAARQFKRKTSWPACPDRSVCQCVPIRSVRKCACAAKPKPAALSDNFALLRGRRVSRHAAAVVAAMGGGLFVDRALRLRIAKLLSIVPAQQYAAKRGNEAQGMVHGIAGDGNRSRHLRPGLLSTMSMRAPWRRATAATRLSPSPLPGVWRLRSSR